MRVLDEGTGIKPEQQHKLFQPFSQLRSGEERGGTGLGLAICRAIAEMHQGFVGLWSAGVGQGTEFWVEWSFELQRPPSRAAIASAGAIPTLQLPPLPQIPGLPLATHSQRGSAATSDDSCPQNPASNRSAWTAGPFTMGSSPFLSSRQGSNVTVEEGQTSEGGPQAAPLGQLGAVQLTSGGVVSEGAGQQNTPQGGASQPAATSAPPGGLPMLPPLPSGAGVPRSPMPALPTLPQLPGDTAPAESADRAEKGLPLFPPQPGPRQGPLQDQGAETGTEGSAAGALTAPDRHQLEGLRIVVVDDQLGNRELLAKHLCRRGATVTPAKDGAEFLTQLASTEAGAGAAAGSTPMAGAVDMVLLDKEMPRMTGYDVLAVVALARGEHVLEKEAEADARRMIEMYGLHLPRIRRALARAHVVGVTGNALREDVEEYKRRGASDVILKPVDIAEVVRVVKRLVRGA